MLFKLKFFRGGISISKLLLLVTSLEGPVFAGVAEQNVPSLDSVSKGWPRFVTSATMPRLVPATQEGAEFKRTRVALETKLKGASFSEIAAILKSNRADSVANPQDAQKAFQWGAAVWYVSRHRVDFLQEGNREAGSARNSVVLGRMQLQETAADMILGFAGCEANNLEFSRLRFLYLIAFFPSTEAGPRLGAALEKRLPGDAEVKVGILLTMLANLSPLTYVSELAKGSTWLIASQGEDPDSVQLAADILHDLYMVTRRPAFGQKSLAAYRKFTGMCQDERADSARKSIEYLRQKLAGSKPKESRHR